MKDEQGRYVIDSIIKGMRLKTKSRFNEQICKRKNM